MSTKDPIEDLFRENQNGLDEAPRSLLWDRIEERLDEKKVQKKKTQWWKYATAACLIGGISLAGFILINQNFAPEYDETSSQIVLGTEMNEEKATEIMDQLEIESTAIVTTKSNAPAPEIMEEEMKEPILIPSKKTIEPAAEISVYDAPVLTSPAAAQMEMESVKPMAKAKQEKILVFRGLGPEEKEGNYIKRYEKFHDRRLGNMAETSVSYNQIQSDSLVVDQFFIKTTNSNYLYKLISKKDDSLIYSNTSVKYPSEIIFILKDKNTKVEFIGHDNYKNSKESVEIQNYVNQNKSWIFSTIQIE